MEAVAVAKDGRSFALAASGRKFTPHGFNYDHDEAGRLIEDYWEGEWPKVEEDIREMKELGANVARVHLQFCKFINAPGQPNEAALRRLAKLVALAERTGLYLDLTGLGCYNKKDVPAWYDACSEKERWSAQADFWEAVARQCAGSPAIFCYDLMNEPVAAGGSPRKAGDWLGPPFGDKCFVQRITLDAAGRTPYTVARDWISTLTAAIRKHDQRTLITVGLVDWSLDRPGLRSGFIPDKIAPGLDFLCVHLYPKKDEAAKDMETLKGFAVGKPVVIEETFFLKCSMKEFEDFIQSSRAVASGWIGFYWGKTPDELRRGKTIPDALMLAWLEFFQRTKWDETAEPGAPTPGAPKAEPSMQESPKP
ncbi:MAG: cellulase family glycosylhydrolase [Candidatus Sumerlaeota bacterium]|nr:cellulase family glycosylhydrolase [Candidatus Sumerlaeota bacterium]